MGHYKSNLRDLEFNLFEVFGRDDVYGKDAFAEIDPDTARSVLSEVERLATEDLAESFADGDRNPPVFDPDTHTATLPDTFKKSYQAFIDAEFWRLGLPEELGGTTAPASLHWAIAELVLGANPAVWMYAGGLDFATVVLRLGTEEQGKVAQRMIDHKWGSTMVLTEPDAGSDVGAGRTKASLQDDGTWHIEGVKRFITSGEHDLSDNIVHLVLARPEGAGPGTKGLSMFIVPKYRFDWETGELGERNGAYVTNVEHKMGLKVSTTCELRFGEERPAVGYLLGEVHDGIRQMFKIIESARMMVGTKAIATLSTGYLNALEYAKERVQGADLTQSTDKSAPRVTITHHPDVRRSLMFQKAYAEGLRALVVYTACVQDRMLQADPLGMGKNADPADVRLNDLLLPIVKGYGSEKSYELLSQSLQTFGGSGYLQDYPLEQYIRDAKIDTLYEGTTAIQGQDFFFRKIVKDQGQALGALANEIKEFTGSLAEGFAAEKDALARATADLEGIVGAMITQLAATEQDVTSLYKVGQNTTRLVLASGDLMVGYLLLRQAVVATEALGGDVSEKDRAFYQGKIAAARFFAANVLPLLTGQRKLAERVDNSIMELPEDAF
ncbi:acyl-CoA dehydrogenase [Mangrovactinospora gilvigrisea]|uniref:Broad-specificity linear acyl-CoA dehydrogenase FadE5 n=1 Tax=Mangrovactinospora gilvigrisea TaxID=1428644 RepID=A0A1J7C9J9_9ACTN|nr:acyl-CoA dehydrogenase [Mangrovactinospora gilvigrisea]OIV38208.1 acyl-CoA dehydrogenase [Mangrovactinospora gilvigrisea]